MGRTIDKKEYEPDKEYIRRLLFVFAKDMNMDVFFIRNPVTERHQFLLKNFMGIVCDKVESWKSIQEYFHLKDNDDIESARMAVIEERANIELIKI